MKTQYRFVMGLAFFILLGFQNCSKVGFTAAPSTSTEDGAGGSGNDDNGGNGNTGPVPTPPPQTVPDVVQSLEPTLAVRGVGCVTCHAKIDSNVVTDLGNGSPYYFSQNLTDRNWWQSGSPFGNHDGHMKTVDIKADKTVFVPKANVPSFVTTAMPGTNSLFDYFKNILSSSPNASTKATTVKEVRAVYIGAPADSDLIEAFQLQSTERIKWKKSKAATVNISGFKDEGTFFTNQSVVYCDGDVVLRGPLHLKNLNLATTAGCRLYVLGSVFIDGPITYALDDTLRNLQITSTKSINMGLGSAKKNGAFCEPTSRWAQESGNASYSRGSSLLTRYEDVWTVPAQQTRVSSNAARDQSDVVAESRLIEAKAGILYDAACTPEGRNVSFDRILLNAPAINNRYFGQIKGTLIAEYALMSLNDNSPFNFVYDPVFKSVDVLPYLKRSLYLTVEE